jgi:hypothetical protein
MDHSAAPLVAICKAPDDGYNKFANCPAFPRAELETIATQSGYAKAAASTEDEWCASDLLYSLLMRPSVHLDKVLAQCHALVLIKNEPDMQRSRIITDTWDLLLRAGNMQVKLFHFLFMLHREPEIQEMMRKGYAEGDNHPLWKDRAHSHLADFLHALEPMIKGTLSWPCSDHNIVDVVHNLVGAARRAYLIL